MTTFEIISKYDMSENKVIPIKWKEVDGYVKGCWGCCLVDRDSDSWEVYHIPTGMPVVFYWFTHGNAVTFIDHLISELGENYSGEVTDKDRKKILESKEKVKHLFE